MPSEAEVYVVRKQVGNDFLMEKAQELRKRDPSMTIEKAFATVFADSDNSVLAMAALGKSAPAFDAKLSDDGAAPLHDPYGQLTARAVAHRQANPHLTHAQAFAHVFQSPENRDLANATSIRTTGARTQARGAA